MPTLLILSKHAELYRTLVKRAQLGDLTIHAAVSASDLSAESTIAEIVFGEPSLIAPVLTRLQAVRWIQSTWAGVEPLLNPALPRDYILTNARGVFGALMCEYVFGYLLNHERRMFEKYESQKAGRWDPKPPGSLRGKLIGLFGVGSIGSSLARMARHFGMRVRGHTRASEACADVDEYLHGIEPEAKQAFARDLDYLVSIAPGTPGTRHFIDATLLAALPSRAVLVNPGRGSTVDERALADALDAGQLARAVLDVFETEPLPPDHFLWRTPNVVITAHTAALSFPEDIVPLFIENYRRFAAGEPLQYQVEFARGY
jgi:phosphoglycerate dehydrogenase-like enzyme